MRRAVAIAVAITATTLIVAVPASGGERGPREVACAKQALPPVRVVGKVRPGSCVLYGRRAIAFVRSMHWKNWGRRKAKGKGELCSARLCMPVRVKLREPKRTWFSQARVHFTGGPHEGDSLKIRLVTRAIG
jgi:hypothetical protein